MYDDFFAQAQGLRDRGEPFATATVVRAEKPTSGKPGDKAIITLDGVMHGWIGGSCAQPAVVREGLKAIADDRSRLIRLTPEPDGRGVREGIEELPMSCFSGGTLDIYIEPQQPTPRLLVVGQLPAARALVQLGRAMSYRTVALDPSVEQSGLEAAHQVETRLERLPELVHRYTYVVVATHGHYDEDALALALPSPVAYVGLIASPKRGEAVRQALAARGLSDIDLAKLRAPAGLDIGARRGDEIALSIMAEIVQLRRMVVLRGAQQCCGEHNTTLVEAKKSVETSTHEAAATEPAEAEGCCCGTVVADP